MTLSPPTNLPRLIRDYSPAQYEACVEWLSHLTLEDLRQRQSLMTEQIEMAFEQAKRPDNLRGEETLQECQDRADQLVKAVLRFSQREGQ